MTTITNDIERTLIKICALVKDGNYRYEYKGSKIHIPSEHYFIELFQQERYDEKLSCLFCFDGFSIFFEHVYEAVEKRIFSVGGGYVSDEDYNKKYLILLFEFIESNLDSINKFPPEWFLDAIDISNKTFASSFPDMALKYKSDGLKLWTSWNFHEQSSK